MENPKLNNEKLPVAVEKISYIFSLNAEKRICVVGTSCVGKSTLLSYLPEAVDMDDLLFGNEQKGIEPLLTQEERDYVCGPWTPEVGQFMTKKAHELIKIEARRPVFGTIVFPSDLVIEITVPDNILRERVRRRNADEKDVFNMKAQIESEIKKSGIEKIVVENI
ncbi:MAG: AAA family ATPase [Candidatus Komeilibacteria bacterium]|nr:AAA family ATPase [Candidatus Komeilibacteria bacterium]